MHDACLIKASSYSLHRPIFSALKDHILESFSTIVQDDTGIPAINLSAFDIKVFGRLKKPAHDEKTWVYLGGLTHDFSSEQEINNRDILERLGRRQGIKFIALPHFDRC